MKTYAILCTNKVTKEQHLLKGRVIATPTQEIVKLIAAHGQSAYDDDFCPEEYAKLKRMRQFSKSDNQRAYLKMKYRIRSIRKHGHKMYKKYDMKVVRVNSKYCPVKCDVFLFQKQSYYKSHKIPYTRFKGPLEQFRHTPDGVVSIVK